MGSVFFKNHLVAYAKYQGKYTLSIRLDQYRHIYIGDRKPLFRNITLIYWLYFPFYYTMYAILLVVALLISPIFFFNTTLLNESFVSETWERIGGYITAILAAIGGGFIAHVLLR